MEEGADGVEIDVRDCWLTVHGVIEGGPADAALLSLPFGIEWHDGVLIVADTGNHVIRKVMLR